MAMGNSKQLLRSGIAATATLMFAQAVPAYAQEQTYSFDIPAQDMGPALRAFARASRQQVAFDDKAVRGRRSTAIKGQMSARQALERLIGGSGLTVERGTSGLFIVRPSAAGAQADTVASLGDGAVSNVDDSDRSAGATPDILVVGRRTINADIKRTEDDAQPYVVFSGDDVRRSQATNLEDFLKTRLPMNSLDMSFSQAAANGNRSTINLRGLGANQTLILVDGRRFPGAVQNASVRQPDINGLPLSAIERIEVLPATASGIYGGGATGGVVNIITRKDYTGLEGNLTFGLTDRGDSGTYRIDASAGIALEGGRTRILVAASHERSEPLYTGDRDFVERARALQFANNPNAFYNLTSPPSGYTTNICSAASPTATTCSNAPLVLDSGASLGSNRTFVPIGYAGSDGGAALVGNAGQYSLGIPNDVSAARRALFSGMTTNSVSVNVNRKFNEKLDVFADFTWLDNGADGLTGFPTSIVTIPGSAPTNPFQNAILVRYPVTGPGFPFINDSTTVRATGGLILRLPSNWSAAADFTWGFGELKRRATEQFLGDPDGSGPGISLLTALQNGTLNPIKDLNAFPLDFGPYLLPTPTLQSTNKTIFRNASFRLSGPIATLPAGKATVTGLLEWREDEAEDIFTTSVNASAARNTMFFPARRQSVLASYAEVRVPLFSEANSISLINELELQGSVRYERYRTVAPSPTSATVPSPEGPLPDLTYSTNRVSATSYTAAVKYSPFKGLSLRGSYNTGFLPPSITQIVPNIVTGFSLALVDPKRGNGTSTFAFTQITSGNPDLSPERSESWSIGAVLSPPSVRGLRLSVDYTNIRKTDELFSPDFQTILNLEDALAGRVIRKPLTPDDIARGYTGGVVESIDRSLLNVTGSKVEAVDIQADYEFDLGKAGAVQLYAVATWQPTFERQTLPTLPFVSSVGFSGGILEWRGNVGLDWTIGGTTLSWNAQYYDSYSICVATDLANPCSQKTLNQGSATVPSQMYHDLSFRHRFSGSELGGSILENVEVLFSVLNVFDKRPPILATIAAADGYSTYGDPRMRRFRLSLRKAF
ncbi:TonB-dependent receptor [Sphingomonas sp. BT-65]|uniref:TonB-dependent receptor n=1 Tax=Sphingomonas sp. BT-65 TaxID=2989821 RepID=UPI0022358F1A|nr:TonB-dependent receptor [Sphingomonas sp. BT-65]MCW4460809.1 TonB-dependent receptor [Sphingomonas sp. BT-65]